MPQFPSVEWFEQVREIFNGEEAYQEAGGGMCDAVMGIRVAGIKVAPHSFILVFEGEECSEARKVAENDLAEADFYLDMASDEWEEMLRNIKDNDGADLGHTLNTLDMGRSEGLAITMNGDQYRQDFFYRYNQTFQYFFDASARIDTEFALSDSPEAK